MARGGKLDINIDAVRLADAEKCPLRAVKQAKGGGHTGAMTAGIVATGLIIWPASPFFLFMHGKDITIPEGTEITAYVNGDMKLDPERLSGVTSGTLPASSSASAGPSPTTVSAPSGSVTVAVTSTPDGAEITVDGKFVGSTPSNLALTPGDRVVSIEKPGFKPWQRTMTLASGASPTINATLEKQNDQVPTDVLPSGSSEPLAAGVPPVEGGTATVNCRGTHGLALFSEPAAVNIVGTFACGQPLSVVKTGLGPEKKTDEVRSSDGQHGYVYAAFLESAASSK